MLTPALLALSLCQTSLPDAAELLDRREARLGPLEKRSGARGVVVEGSLSMPGGPAATFEELHRVGPGEERVRFTLTMEGWGSTSQGTDGKVSWTTDPAFGVSVQEGVEQMAVRRVWALQRSTPWRALYRSARTIGPAERDGRQLLELELTPAEGKSERWFVDPATLELVRVAVVYPNPTGGALPMEWTFGDWRAVDGILYPHERGQVVQGGVAAGGETADALPMRFTYTCSSIRHEPVELARVAPAPEVAAAIADPKLRAPAPPKDPDACALETVARQHVATVRLTCDVDKVSATLASIFPEVGTVLQAQGAAMSGPPFSRYHVIDVEQGKIDLEAGIPVAAPITPSGRVKASELPAGRTAVTWHTGSYHDLQKSYDRLGAWMKREGLSARGGFWEIYWTDPGLEPDPSTWRTQILWPVE
ncbi:MAG TPA: GyrI-like domain-containing protein [Planctomycetota bacterium]